MKYTINFIKLSFFILYLFVFLYAAINFKGNPIYYVLFSFISVSSLVFSFREKGFFFEKFISIYLWLGFWLKYSLYIGVFPEQLPNGLGNFELIEDNVNNVLLIASIPFVSITFSSILINKFNILKLYLSNNSLVSFYYIYKNIIIFLIIILVLLITTSNYYFGIYQKGLLPSTELHFLISGFYKYLLLMGFGILLSLILDLELKNEKKISIKLYLLLISENLFTNLSLLSRASIFNISAIFFGIYKSIEKKVNLIKNNFKRLFIFYLFASIIFLLSVIFINEFRQKFFYTEKFNMEDAARKENLYKSLIINSDLNNIEKETFVSKDEQNQTNTSIEKQKNSKKELIEITSSNNQSQKKTIRNRLFDIAQLVYIRFVGIEALMAVYGHENLNFKHLDEAFKEKLNFNDYNHYYLKYHIQYHYDKETKFKNDKTNLKEKQYTIHVPGIVAFLFYPGSNIFLFVSLTLIFSLSIIIEKFVIYSSAGNIILASFLFLQKLYN